MTRMSSTVAGASHGLKVWLGLSIEASTRGLSMWPGLLQNGDWGPRGSIPQVSVPRRGRGSKSS